MKYAVGICTYFWTPNWTTSNYYGKNGSMMQQHEFLELDNLKISGDIASSYLKVCSE